MQISPEVIRDGDNVLKNIVAGNSVLSARHVTLLMFALFCERSIISMAEEEAVIKMLASEYQGESASFRQNNPLCACFSRLICAVFQLCVQLTVGCRRSMSVY